MNEENNTIDIYDIFYSLKKHIVFVLVTTLLFAILSVAYTKFLITPKYQSSASMIVNTVQDEKVIIMNDQNYSAKKLISTYCNIIQSDAVLDKVIENLDLEMSSKTLRSKITVSPEGDTQILNIVVTDKDSYTAKLIADEIIKVSPNILEGLIENGEVKVLTQAQENKSPVADGSKKKMLIFTLLGFVLSIIVIIVRDYFDNTIKNVSDVNKYLELPVLGIIPKIGGNK